MSAPSVLVARVIRLPVLAPLARAVAAEDCPKKGYPKVDRSARVLSAGLGRIVATKRGEVERLGSRREELRARAAAASGVRPFAAALRRPDEVAVIAELKRRSPSAGWLRREVAAAALGRTYAAAGAAAISVLTDTRFFGGTLADLEMVRAAVSIPVLRKDFVLDAVQIDEARVAGADAVLLIVRLLSRDQLADLFGHAVEIGMEALVETHDAAEIELALAVGARVIGINNRDLDTFRTDPSLALRLGAVVPADRVVVAESAVTGAADVDAAGAAGIDAVLVGEALMRSADPATTLRGLVGRRRAGHRSP
jgi:indole-3-glycerol phosphate synthase